MSANNIVLCPKCGKKNDKSILNCKTCNSILKLNEKYFLTNILGENREVTYIGVDSDKNNKRVIIKELKVNLLENWKDQELFTREILTLKTISHDKIPNLIDDFKFQNNHYLVIEFVDGINLKIESEEKKYTEKEVLDVLRGVLDILKYLHTLEPPIIHRDIKLSNIMRDRDKSLHLIDFGSVKDVLKIKGGSTVVGSYGYMAPEQFMGNAYVQSDYYSLGAVALILLTKKEPDTIISDEFISSLDISNQMKALIRKATKIKIKERVKSYTDFLGLIENFNTLEFTFKKEEEVKKESKNLSSEFLEFKKRYIELTEDVSNIKLTEDKNKDTSETMKSIISVVFIFTMLLLVAILLYFLKINGWFFIIILFISSMIFYEFINRLWKNTTKGISKEESKTENRLGNKFWDKFKDTKDKELLLVVSKENIEDEIHKNNIVNIIYNNCDIDRGKLIIYKNLLRELKDEQ